MTNMNSKLLLLKMELGLQLEEIFTGCNVAVGPSKLWVR